MISARSILAIAFRLSIVLGLAFGAYDAFNNFADWNTASNDYAQNTRRMECAVSIEDEWLKKHTNEFGNIDVASRCGAGKDGKTFFTNLDEINLFKAGEDFLLPIGMSPYNIPKTVFAFLAVFLGVNLAAAALAILYRIGRWIALGSRR